MVLFNHSWAAHIHLNRTLHSWVSRREHTPFLIIQLPLVQAGFWERLCIFNFNSIELEKKKKKNRQAKILKNFLERRNCIEFCIFQPVILEIRPSTSVFMVQCSLSTTQELGLLTQAGVSEPVAFIYRGNFPYHFWLQTEVKDNIPTPLCDESEFILTSISFSCYWNFIAHCRLYWCWTWVPTECLPLLSLEEGRLLWFRLSFLEAIFAKWHPHQQHFTYLFIIFMTSSISMYSLYHYLII